ncbi:MAG: PepSY domain-containing protein [Mariniblastus sp.]
MATAWNRWSRKLHRWGAIITLVPLFLVIVSGLLLQVKKQVSWVQPATIRGVGKTPEIDWPQMLAATSTVPESQVNSWEDIDRIDVRPNKGVAKIQCANRWEVQVDLETGDVLTANYRRSDFIESLHDGSFFSDFAKLWIFLPNGLILLGLWFSGLYLWWLPIGAKRKKRLRKLQTTNADYEN